MFTTFEVLVSSYILDSETNFIFFCAFIFIYPVHFIILSIDIIFFSQILPEKMLDFLDAPVPYIVSYKCTAFSGSSYKCSRVLKILFYIWRILRLTFLIIPASRSLFYSGNSGMIWKDICWDFALFYICCWTSSASFINFQILVTYWVQSFFQLCFRNKASVILWSITVFWCYKELSRGVLTCNINKLCYYIFACLPMLWQGWKYLEVNCLDWKSDVIWTVHIILHHMWMRLRSEI